MNDKTLYEDLWRRQTLWKAEGLLCEALSMLIGAKIDLYTQEKLEQVLQIVKVERS